MTESYRSTLSAIACVIGETVIRNYGGEWIEDEDYPEGKMGHMSLTTGTNMIWPWNRVMSRVMEGPESGGIYRYIKEFEPENGK